MFIEEIVGAFTGQNRRTRHKHVAIGTTLGFLGGAVLALLFAPQSGKETREDIKKCAEKGKDAATELACQGYNKAKDLATLATDKVGEITSDLGEYSSALFGEAGCIFDKTTREAARKARIASRKARKMAQIKAQALADSLNAGLEADELDEEVLADVEDTQEEIKE